MSDAEQDAAEAAAELRYRKLPTAWRAVLIAVASAAVFLALNQLLNLGFFVGKTILASATHEPGPRPRADGSA